MTVRPGVVVEQRVSALSRVGCYVPGGRYPLPSSLLMTAIPAAVAGVREIVAVCPRPEPVVLAAAVEAGVTRLFRAGGAHAIAALAYGTESVPRVDKIVGPGNAYVAAAKNLVAKDCPIDFQAGPTEIVVLARNGRPDWIAADLVAQAEHDPQARAILITTSRRLASRVSRAVSTRMPQSGPAREALRNHGGIIVAKDRNEAAELADLAAPERLVCDDQAVADPVTLSPARSSSAGTRRRFGRLRDRVEPCAADERGGPLPGRPACGGLRTPLNRSAVDRKGLKHIGSAVVTLARQEGLEGHALSIEVRLR